MLAWSAPEPTAVLRVAVLLPLESLLLSARLPIAVLPEAILLKPRAPAPLAVLKLPVVFAKSADLPVAVLLCSRVVNERLIANSSVIHIRNNHPNSCCARSAGWTCCARSAG